jgi:hypothetical protein
LHRRLTIPAAILIAGLGRANAGVAQSVSAPCGASQGLSFVCGADRPEDLAHIPGTKWLVVTGFTDGAGLKLIDTDSGKLRAWYTGDPTQIQPDRIHYANCPSAPDPKTFNVQGLSLRAFPTGLHTLYATNHGGRESIEIFTIDARRDEPSLSWNGCVVLPTGVAANSVATFSDGTILITELIRTGTTIADFVNGKNTGAVYEWKPGTASFKKIPGTDLPGNNGLETSRDDHEFYVVAFGWHAVLAFARADPSKPARRAKAPGFMPDNIHWDSDKLIVGGMQSDEPACGGTRKVIDGRADGMRCHRGYVIAQLDPKPMVFSVMAYAEPNPDFNGVSGAVVVNGELWLSSYQADRVAHRPLPGAPHDVR